MYSMGWYTAKLQKRKMAITVPTAQMLRAVVTWYRSTSRPLRVAPMMVAALHSEIAGVPLKLDHPCATANASLRETMSALHKLLGRAFYNVHGM